MALFDGRVITLIELWHFIGNNMTDKLSSQPMILNKHFMGNISYSRVCRH